MNIYSEMEELKEIVENLREFVYTNDSDMETTLYYTSTGDQTFLELFEQVVINHEDKEKYVIILKNLFIKAKDFYSRLLENEYDPTCIEFSMAMEDSARFLGFSDDSGKNLFSKLETTIEHLEK